MSLLTVCAIFLMLSLAVIAIITARTIERSQLGFGFATIRDDELAAEATGAANPGAADSRRVRFGEGGAQRIDCDPGRVAVAPARELIDQPAVGVGFDSGRDQVGQQGACIGQTHVHAEAGGAGVGVERFQPRAAIAPGDGGGGPGLPLLKL